MKKKILGLAFAGAATIACLSLTSCNNSVAGAGEEFDVIDLNLLKGEETTVVNFWHSFGDSVSSALNPLIDGDDDTVGFNEWCEENGYNIKVKITNKGGGYDGLRQSVNMGVQSNNLPTLVLGYPDHFADYINQGLILDLDEYVYNENKDIALEGVSSASNDFVKTYWEEVNMDCDGDGKKDVVGVPFNKSTEIMCYNSNVVDPILQELEKSNPTVFPAGTYNKTTGAWDNPTWDQLIEVSKYIVEHKTTISYNYKNGTYGVDASMAYPTYIDSESNFFITTARQWGGEGAYTTEAGEVTAKNASTKSAMEYFLAAANKNYLQLPAAGGTGSYGSSYMQVLKAFISIGSTAGVKNNAGTGKYEMKATTVPQKSYDDTSYRAVIQQGTNLAILTPNSNNKTRMAAWLLIKWLTNTENQVTFSTNTGYIPVRKSSQESDEFADILAAADTSNIDYAFNGAVARGLTAAFKEQDYFYTDPAFKGSSIVRDKVGAAVNDMFLYKKSYDTAMDTFYTTLKQYKITTK